jgi:hypothetical protein
MAKTAIQAAVTKTAAFDGAGIDISAITGDWTLFLRISELKAASGTPTAIFAFEHVAAADFTTPINGPTFCFQGPISLDSIDSDVVVSVRKRDFPALKAGVTDGKVRLALETPGGTTPSVTYDSWMIHD